MHSFSYLGVIVTQSPKQFIQSCYISMVLKVGNKYIFSTHFVACYEEM